MRHPPVQVDSHQERVCRQYILPSRTTRRRSDVKKMGLRRVRPGGEGDEPVALEDEDAGERCVDERGRRWVDAFG